jgi:phage shock protein PspC (stress-responsive transcriptional regulator)
VADTSGEHGSHNPAHEHAGETHIAGEHHTDHGHAAKQRFNLKAWLMPNGKLSLENLSYLMLFASTAMIAIGVGLGTFVRYTVYIASAGSLLLLAGIVIYIISQLMAPESETGGAKA